MADFQEKLKAFWDTHPSDEGWGISTEVKGNVCVATIIGYGGRVVVTAHAKEVSMENLESTEERAIERAIDRLP